MRYSSRRTPRERREDHFNGAVGHGRASFSLTSARRTGGRCIKPAESNYTFGAEQPSERDWATWAEFWTQLTGAGYTIDTPLGAWVAPTHRPWHWKYDAVKDELRRPISGETEVYRRDGGVTNTFREDILLVAPRTGRERGERDPRLGPSHPCRAGTDQVHRAPFGVVRRGPHQIFRVPAHMGRRVDVDGYSE